eukprot:3318087-Ditylum_brightwellii.AAC.1
MRSSFWKGERFILAGAFDESLTGTSGMTKFCSDDTLHILGVLGDLTNEHFSASKTGHEHIDYILASPEM